MSSKSRLKSDVIPTNFNNGLIGRRRHKKEGNRKVKSGSNGQSWIVKPVLITTFVFVSIILAYLAGGG